MRQLTFIVLLVAFTIRANACRCGDELPVREAALTADAIVVGRAMKLSVSDRKMGEDRYREVVECEFKIITALKGIGAGTEKVTIITSSAGTACGYPFRIGDEYLVYARKVQNELETNVCMRTRSRIIIDEKQDLSVIAKFKGDDAMDTEVPHIRAALEE